ncbi:PAS domain S-box protein [Candidatus Sumerlaeota bacterium]|nr:PAS domain S-box protein [Candidatus Sumerlaeota bacterium]
MTEHNPADARLAGSKDVDWYRALFEWANDGIATIDNGIFTDCNQQVLKILQCAKDQVIGHTPGDISPPFQLDGQSSADKAREMLRRADAGESMVFEWLHCMTDGTPIPCEISLNKIQTGDRTTILVLMRDITDRKKAEQAVRLSESRFRALVENAGDAFFLCMKDGEILDVNQRACESLGFTREELLTMTIEQIDIQSGSESNLDEFRNKLRPGKSATIEGVHRRKDGTTFPVEVRVGLMEMSGEHFLLGLARDVSERKQTIERLQESEEKYRALFENSLEGMLISKNEQVISANQALLNMLGYASQEEIAGKTILDHVAPESREMAMNILRQEAEGKHEPRFFELKALHQDGSLRDIEISSINVVIGDEQYMQSIIRDVTERNQSQAALRERDAMIHALVETSRDWIWSINLEGVHTYSNPAIREILGYEPDEIVGKSCFNLIHEQDLPVVREHILQKTAEKKGWSNFLIRWRHKDSSWRFLESNAVPIFDAAGELTGFQGVDRDVTERVHTGEQLRQLHTAIEQIVDGVMICDPDGVVSYVNPALERITGYARSELVGRPANLLDDGSDDKEFFLKMRETIMTNQFWQGRRIWRGKGGEPIILSITISSIVDAKKNVIGSVAAMRDITEQTRFEKQLRQAQKMEAIGNLAGGIAHDFNNILAAMLGYTEIAINELDSGVSPNVDNLRNVLESGERAKELVNQILAFSRQSEKQKIPVDLKAIVKEVLKFLRASLPSTIEIRQNVEAKVGAVSADPTQMHQIIMNLCTNAWHAMRENGGTLEVGLKQVELDAKSAEEHSLQKPGDYVLLTVHDTGHGIDAQVLDRIFDPFFTTKGQGKGTGMGLAVVHGIVKSHQGAISVHTETGKGTTFEVILPRIETSAESIPIEDEQAPMGTERILIVDDEEMLVNMIRRMLEPLGYHVTARTGSEEAYQTFMTSPEDFDLVLTDLTMPKMTGFQLALEILETRPDMPILLCTGYSDAITPDEARNAGIREMMMKPLTKRELAIAIRRALDHQK